MRKQYRIFQLGNAVSDVTRIEVLYDDYSYTLDHFSKCTNEPDSYSSEEEAEAALKEIIKDYNKREISNCRFIILPIYLCNNEDIFK